MTHEVETTTDAEADHINPVLHLVAPLAAIVATMVVRSVMNRAYESITGHEPPAPRDPSVRLSRALLWTAATATTAAVVEVAVYRLTNQAGSKRK